MVTESHHWLPRAPTAAEGNRWLSKATNGYRGHHPQPKETDGYRGLPLTTEDIVDSRRKPMVIKGYHCLPRVTVTVERSILNSYHCTEMIEVLIADTFIIEAKVPGNLLNKITYCYYFEQKYKRRYLGNATITKHSSPETPKEGGTRNK